MEMTVTNENVHRLVEQIRDWRSEDLHVDKPNRLVSNVALTARESKNGYRYSEEALRQAVRLYDNKPVFLDHAANVSRPHERSTRDLVGSIVDPRYENGRIRGDIQVLETEAGRTFLALAESRNASVGMSHVVLAERSRDRSVVEAIHDVVSVDAVVFPATSSTFSESVQDDPSTAVPGSLESFLQEVDRAIADRIGQRQPDARIVRRGIFPEEIVLEIVPADSASARIGVVEWNFGEHGIELGEQITPVTAEQLEGNDWRRSGRPSFLEWLQAARSVTSLQEQIAETARQRDRLRDELERVKSEQQRAADLREIEQMIESAGLPDYAVTDLFRQQLVGAPDAETRRTLINERKSVLGRGSLQRPLSRERPAENDPLVSDAAIVAAIKRQRSSALAGIG